MMLIYSTACSCVARFKQSMRTYEGDGRGGGQGEGKKRREKEREREIEEWETERMSEETDERR